ncbi:MAG: hypothetical protein PF483_09765 [Halothiobacillus sp.]|jgi:hypothetical protein|nr:hypothetical protein [Halothiobacillus sp.]
MSKRNWVFIVAVGLIALLSVSAAGIYWSSNSFLAYQNGHAKERQEAAANNARQAQRANQSCWPSMVKLGPSGWLACVVENISADQSANQPQYDLKTQQDMAEWGYGSFLLSIFTFALSITGVVAVLVSLGQTRKALNHAGEANAISKEIGEKQVRAYLTITSSTFIMNKINKLIFEIDLRNSGQSPALNLSIQATIFFRKEGVPDFEVFGEEPYIGHGDISGASDGKITIPCPDTISEIEGTGMVKIDYTVGYETVFSRKRKSFDSSSIMWVYQLPANPGERIRMSVISTKHRSDLDRHDD